MSRTERVKLAGAAALVALSVLLALLPKDWIEETFGFEPDAENGFVELLIFVVPIAIGIALATRVHLAVRARAAHRPATPEG